MTHAICLLARPLSKQLLEKDSAYTVYNSGNFSTGCNDGVVNGEGSTPKPRAQNVRITFKQQVQSRHLSILDAEPDYTLTLSPMLPNNDVRSVAKVALRGRTSHQGGGAAAGELRG